MSSLNGIINERHAYQWSPSLTFVTPGPHLTTTPAPSCPKTWGKPPVGFAGDAQSPLLWVCDVERHPVEDAYAMSGWKLPTQHVNPNGIHQQRQPNYDHWITNKPSIFAQRKEIITTLATHGSLTIVTKPTLTRHSPRCKPSISISRTSKGCLHQKRVSIQKCDVWPVKTRYYRHPMIPSSKMQRKTTQSKKSSK